MKQVDTMHSTYWIDEEAHTLRREPRETGASTLRSDGETVQLIEVVFLEVGFMAEFMIQLPGVEASTCRRTTMVTRVTDVDGEASAQAPQAPDKIA